MLLKLRDWFFSQAGNILLALIIFWIGRRIIGWIKNVAIRIMTKAQYDSAAMSFVAQIINYVLLARVGFDLLESNWCAYYIFCGCFWCFWLRYWISAAKQLGEFGIWFAHPYF